MSISVRKTVTAGIAALALGSAIVATATSAEAGWRGRGGWGGPAAVGIIGGLALGAIAAQAAQPHYAPAPAYDSYGNAGYGYGNAGNGYPVAGGYGGYAEPYCRVERRPTYNPWGEFAGWRPVRVCN